jgi:hypothetical protein
LIFLSSLLFFAAGCGEKKASSNALDSTSSNLNDTLEVSQIETPVRDTSLHCIRGEAQPIVLPSAIGKSKFKYNSDGITGIERVLLTNGDSLTINNWGCEFYALTFRFNTKRYSGDTTNVKFWLGKAAILMKEISGGINPPLDIESGTILLSKASLDKDDYSWGQWFTYGNEIIGSSVSLDRVRNIGNGQFSIEITYSIGPL